MWLYLCVRVQCHKDPKLWLKPECGFTCVFVQCHKDPKLWLKPEQFYPEHFLDDHGALKV
jgi:hypothetical protein